MRNMFTERASLDNEADVEQSMLRPLFKHLGYADRMVRPKAKLADLTSGEVVERSLERPDFAIKVKGHIRWICEAKHPDENLDNHLDQPRNYAFGLNDSYPNHDPVVFYLLSNGDETRLYRQQDDKLLVSLGFSDFDEQNAEFARLVDYLNLTSFTAAAIDESPDILTMKKPTVTEINRVFAQCHQDIHKSDSISQARAFEEFVKLVTLKLLSDREIIERNPGLVAEDEFEISSDEIEFSTRWIEQQGSTNPVDEVLFVRFIRNMNTDIEQRRRKRIFEANERIALKPKTIRGVVERLQDLFLYGIDADLNGRLFEQFLSATMRGKDLGQYFTPRTIVKLGVKLARLGTEDRVLDGCCGTGGFLIEALAEMWGKVKSNHSLTAAQRQERLNDIADEQIFGIDIGNSPNLARIARLNMYLHGDGGSRIYSLDALDLEMLNEDGDTAELIAERADLKNLIGTIHVNESPILAEAIRFDVVLTNPPFSKVYDRHKESDSRILEQYTFAGAKRSVSAKLLFFEMYHRYLKVGGRLVSVIDDGFLSSKDHRGFRDALRRLYVIKAVISLPGDAFQRSDARVKTSFIVLEKRDPAQPRSSDPPIFMAACRFVGLDDPARQRAMPSDAETREAAKHEVDDIATAYNAYLDGSGDNSDLVEAGDAPDRLDVKNCLIRRDRRAQDWNISDDVNLSMLKDVVELRSFGANDIVVSHETEDPVQQLTVRYDGVAEGGSHIVPADETRYPELYRVRTGDIVISNIAATHGSVAVVPTELDGCVTSKEYTILRAKQGFDPRVIRAVLRSPEMRAELLLRASGANRTRIRWADIETIMFPYPADNIAIGLIDEYEKLERAQRRVTDLAQSVQATLTNALDLGKDEARFVWDAFKPPK